MTDPSRRADRVLGRLPAGVVPLAHARLRSAYDQLARRTGRAPVETAASIGAAARYLVAPIALGEDWPGPTPPVPVGDGAVHADLTDDDAELFAVMRRTLRPDQLRPETLAAEAQTWRLPVTPYRPMPATGDLCGGVPAAAGERIRVGSAPPDGPPGDALDGMLVVDLTGLWAGPLATGLLAAAGARVVKLDPSCRPDALAAHPRLYRELNAAKETLDLDLRLHADRARFEALVTHADLVIDAFSRRVMPNFGYGPAALATLAAAGGNPSLATMSIVAFPAGGPEQDWTAYGPGVHAAVGLGGGPGGDPGVSGRIRWQPAPIAYPDPLAGLTAFAAAVGVLTDPARRRGAPGGHHEISLAGVLAPLVAGRDDDHRLPGARRADHPHPPRADQPRADQGTRR
ncbi:MAG: CoA transferase [Acidimicrobiales bacterium]